MKLLFLTMTIVGAVLTLLISGSATGAIVDITTQVVGNKLNLDTIEVTSPGGAANRLYMFGELVVGTVTDYQSIQEYASPGTTISVLATPDPAPAPGVHRLEFIFDAALNTGLLNIATGTPGLVITFDRPVVNAPGQEIVIFELTVGNGQLPDSLVVQSADGRGTSHIFTSSNYNFTGPIPAELTPITYQADVGQAGDCNLEELLNLPLQPSLITNPKFNALPINLDQLNIPQGESVQALVIRSNSTDPLQAADILMVVGMQAVPEPAGATLVLGCLTCLAAIRVRPMRRQSE
jgi:hypothetical protein